MKINIYNNCLQSHRKSVSLQMRFILFRSLAPLYGTSRMSWRERNKLQTIFGKQIFQQFSVIDFQ